LNARMLIPSKYFSPADFEGEMLVTIEKVQFVDLEVEGKGGKAATTETRGSLIIKESPKPWVCNVTNTKCLIAMFGEEDVERRWAGKRVTIYAERVMSFGEWTLGVRIKGSPDITAPVSVRLKLRKKREQVLNMAVTSAAPRAAAHQNGNGTTTPVSPNDAMWRDFRAAGLTDPKQYAALRASSTGKSKVGDLTQDDVFKFSEALKAMTAASSDGPPPEEPQITN
jgi:hypothetical protein